MIADDIDDKGKPPAYTNHYRALLDNLPFPAWLKDTESRFVAVNEVFARIFCANDADSLIGKTDFDIAPRHLAERYRADDQQVLTTLQKLMLEEEIIDRGVRKWFETHKAPVVDEQGTLLGTVGHARDISERKTAERILAENEERFRQIYENSGDAILFAWPDGRIESANPAACKLFGYHVDELRQLGRSGIMDHTDPGFKPALMERSRTGKYRGELRCVRRDGHIFIAELISTQFADSRGEIRTVDQFRDITERKRAEALQRENQQRLELALAGADLGMWDWTIATDLHLFDERWANMLGEQLDHLETVVDTWASRVHPEDWPTVNAAWSAHARGETKVYEVDYRLRHKAGHYIWVAGRGKVIERDADGQPLRAVGTHLDISLHKSAERLEQEQLARLQSRENALSAITQGVLITGADQLITYSNSGFESMTGYTMTEVLGRNCNFLRGPDTNHETVARISKALAAGEPFHGEILNYRKDGSPFWNGLSIVPVFDAAGEITQFVGVLRNITTRKHIEDELAEYAQRTESMSRRLVAAQEEMRRRLSAELHDRTSPNLAAISINLRLLATALGATEQTEIAAQLEDTRALIEDTAASIREISVELRPPLLDYAGLLPAMESYTDHLTRRTGIAIKINCPDRNLVLDPTTESALFRIFQEALTNCAKHANATSAEVSLTRQAETLVLSITDNGNGFDPITPGTMPFGNGLGLINMKEMAEFSGGNLSVTSQPGAGTRVYLEMPDKPQGTTE